MRSSSQIRMNESVKHLRTKAGLTQRELAEKTGLSIRTIQRIESNNLAPKGHTLKTLSTFFGVETNALAGHSTDVTAVLKTINLSVLVSIILPLFHIALPVLIWRRHKAIPAINDAGRQIISVQIFWSIGYVLLMIVSGFLQALMPDNIPLILLVMLMLIIINIAIVSRTAQRITQGNLDLFPTELRLM